jgi:hypothetical protein
MHIYKLGMNSHISDVYKLGDLTPKSLEQLLGPGGWTSEIDGADGGFFSTGMEF